MRLWMILFLFSTALFALSIKGEVEFDQCIKPSNQNMLFINLKDDLSEFAMVNKSHKAKYKFLYLDKKSHQLTLDTSSGDFYCIFKKNGKPKIEIDLTKDIDDLDISCKCFSLKKEDYKAVNIKPGLWRIVAKTFYPNGQLTPAPVAKERKCIEDPSKDFAVETLRRVGTHCELKYKKQGFKEGEWEQLCSEGNSPTLIKGHIDYKKDKIFIRHDYYSHNKPATYKGATLLEHSDKVEHSFYIIIEGERIGDCKK